MTDRSLSARQQSAQKAHAAKANNDLPDDESHYIFVTGGTVSGLGKGIAAAAIGALLRARGYSVRNLKLDPYLNVDSGTLSPHEHGECFVTEDGAEGDLDLGHYERFTDRPTLRDDTMTTGRIFQGLLERERRGDFLGATIQIVPHLTNEIKAHIRKGNQGYDFVIIEIGGTVGDIEATPFIESIRQLHNDLPDGHAIFIHLILLPYLKMAGELKTKPAQHSVKDLQALGIQPNILLCRTEVPIGDDERHKLALFCNLRDEAVVEAADIESSIYEIPKAYHEAGLDSMILKAFHIAPAPKPDMRAWDDVVARLRAPKHEVTIAIVAKYTKLKDAYKSVIEALTHGGIANHAKVNINWYNAEDLEDPDITPEEIFDLFAPVDGILVPGGFGTRGVEGKIAAIRTALMSQTPFLGICLGMQLAVVEAARRLPGHELANSTEFGETPHPVIGKMTEWMRGDDLQKRKAVEDLGGTMRLGAYPTVFKADSKIAKIYGTQEISERHRHRYEVNRAYVNDLQSLGMVFSGTSPDGLLIETIEYAYHPFFIGTQYHPEFGSRPFAPHPLFTAFISAALAKARRLGGHG